LQANGRFVEDVEHTAARREPICVASRMRAPRHPRKRGEDAIEAQVPKADGEKKI